MDSCSSVTKRRKRFGTITRFILSCQPLKKHEKEGRKPTPTVFSDRLLGFNYVKRIELLHDLHLLRRHRLKEDLLDASHLVPERKG